MAATGRKEETRIQEPAFRRSCLIRGLALILLASGLSYSRADEPGPARSAVRDIATALSDGNPSTALEPFSKSFRDYEKLRDYFLGLTNAFTIVNEVDVTEEANSASESTATVRWAITLSSASDKHSNQRTAEIHVRSVREKKKWRIVEFSPIDLFDPAQAQTPTPIPK